MKYKNAILFVKPTPEAEETASTLRGLLEEMGVSACKYSEETNINENTIAFVLGGDGTMLMAAEKLYGKNIPIVGINLGYLGFLTELDACNMGNELETLLSKNAFEETRPYFNCTLTRQGKVLWDKIPFMNDTVIQRQPDHKMVQLRTKIGNQIMSFGRADGLVVATPTGSTAYNLSTGGSILHPAVNGLILAPICPHSLNFRPVVIPPLDVEIILESDDAALLSVDGRRNYHLKPMDSLKITQSTENVTLRYSDKPHFFGVLRKKLGWG